MAIKENRECEICGVSFKIQKYWQKFCSKSCKQASWAINKIKPALLGKILKERAK